MVVLELEALWITKAWQYKMEIMPINNIERGDTMAKYDINKARAGTLYLTPLEYKLVKKGAKKEKMSVKEYIIKLAKE